MDSAYNLIRDSREMLVFNCDRESDTREDKVRYSYNLSMYQLRTCFNLSRQTENQHRGHMTFVEFIEFVCRVAWVCKADTCSDGDKFEPILELCSDQARV
jgi:hypothetical protein